ncbi:MAG: hypothetical protein ACO1QB_12645, partial [Verrucomicrobiales bacterium]
MHTKFFQTLMLLAGLSTGAPQLNAQTNASPVFKVKMPGFQTFRIATNTGGLRAFSVPTEWVKATSEESPNEKIELGKRLVLQLGRSEMLKDITEAYGLKVDRDLGGGVYILETDSAHRCLQIAAELAEKDGVIASYPVIKREQGVKGPYSAQPNDAYFPQQWPLENRGSDGAKLGPDLNVRGA